MSRINAVCTVCICVVTLLSVCATESKKLSKRASESESCGKALALSKNVSSYKFKAPSTTPKNACEWTFIGEIECSPSLSCSEFELNEDSDKNYLQVSDGFGRSEKFIGKNQLSEPIKSTSRDLYVKFQSSSIGKFECEVKCEADPQAKPLAESRKMKESQTCVCGLQNKDDRIVGGQDVKMNEFPWQAVIVRNGTRAPLCGGSIINDRHVLTASHCFVFEKLKPENIEVLFHVKVIDPTILKHAKNVEWGVAGSVKAPGWNEVRQSDESEKTQRFKVLEINNHPLFTKKYDYDVSIVKLDAKIDLSDPDAPTPICLPKLEATDTKYETRLPWVVGFGLASESAGSSTRALQKLEVPVIPMEKCQHWMPKYMLTSRMLCAGYEEGERDACTGDSGGPLILKQDGNQWEQIGVVSWGEGCARKQRPGLYARVYDFMAFIRQNTQGATWCRRDK